MKKFIKYLLKRKFLLLIILVSSFLLGFTTTNLINTYTSSYRISFKIEDDSSLSFNEMLTKEYLLKIVDKCNGKNTYYNEISIDKIVKEKGISILKNDTEYTLYTKVSYYPDFFLKSSSSVSTRAKTFLKTMLNTYAEENNKRILFLNSNIIEKETTLSNSWIYIISSISSISLTSIYIIISYTIFKKNKDLEEIPYDNDSIFFTPFHKKYWKDVFKTFKDVRKITGLAMMLSLMLLCKLISLPSGFGNLGISATYIVFAIASMIYGPFAGFVLGILSDTIGYLLFQTAYTWFIGYTIQAALSGLVYGLLLYKTKISYSRCFIARLIVNIILNVIWGSICWGIVSGYTFEQTYSYALIFSLPKNLIYLVPQSLVLYLLLKALCPPLSKIGLIDKSQYSYYIMQENELQKK